MGDGDDEERHDVLGKPGWRMVHGIQVSGQERKAGDACKGSASGEGRGGAESGKANVDLTHKSEIGGNKHVKCDD